MQDRTSPGVRSGLAGFSILLALLLFTASGCKPREETSQAPERTSEEPRRAGSSANGPMQVVEVPPFVELAKNLSLLHHKRFFTHPEHGGNIGFIQGELAS